MQFSMYLSKNMYLKAEKYSAIVFLSKHYYLVKMKFTLNTIGNLSLCFEGREMFKECEILQKQIT